MTTSRRLCLLTSAVLLLAGCSDSPDPADDTDDAAAGSLRLEATDGSFTVDVPDDWEMLEVDPGQIVLAAQGSDPLDQLVVTTHESVEAATDEAVSVTAGLAGRGIACERLDDATVYGEGRLLFDCPQETEDGPVRRVFVPVDGDGPGLLVLLQTTGATLQDTGTLGRPVLDSLTFR